MRIFREKARPCLNPHRCPQKLKKEMYRVIKSRVCGRDFVFMIVTGDRKPDDDDDY
jgi:hypothetical protein